MSDHLLTEEQLISILLLDKESVAHWLSSPITASFFDKQHEPILSGITYSHNNNVQLTRDAYRQFCTSYNKVTNPNELAAQMTLYTRCLMKSANKDELPILLESVRKAYIARKTSETLSVYKNKRDKIGISAANIELVSELQKLESSTVDNRAIFTKLADAKEEYMAALQDRRNNPHARLTCGIPEIDDTMTVGFKEGHLTLFSSDVGSYKTTIMVNVCVNIHKLHNVNVLYIPLEMPRDEIITKIIARELSLDMHRISRAEKLTEEEIKLVAEEFEKLKAKENSFAIMQMNGRSKVSTIRREIEKRISYFKPRIVCVDYADNLIPEAKQSQNHLEINDMLADLRSMGMELGFSVISAAQLTREALKKLQEQKPGSQRIGSTDLRGGQVYTANSDNVYAQLKDPELPHEQLLFFAVKCRHGKPIFENGKEQTILRVRPEIALIESATSINLAGLPQDTDVLELINKQPNIEDVDESPF